MNGDTTGNGQPAPPTAAPEPTGGPASPGPTPGTEGGPVASSAPFEAPDTVKEADLRREVTQLETMNDDLRQAVKTLQAQNESLAGELREAKGEHEPIPFPCALYRDGKTAHAANQVELDALLSDGWKDSPAA